MEDAPTYKKKISRNSLGTFPYLEPEGRYGEAFVPGGYFPIHNKNIGFGRTNGDGSMSKFHKSILKHMPKVIHLDACLLDDGLFRQFLIGLPKCTTGLLLSRCSLRKVARVDAIVDFILSRAETFSHLRIEDTGMTYASILKIIHAIQFVDAPLISLEICERMIYHGSIRDALYEMICGSGRGGMVGGGLGAPIIHPKILRIDVPNVAQGEGGDEGEGSGSGSGGEGGKSPFPLYMWTSIVRMGGGGSGSGGGGGRTLRIRIPDRCTEFDLGRFLTALGDATDIQALEMDGSSLGRWDRGRLLKAISRMSGLRSIVVDKELFCEEEFICVLREAGAGLLERAHVYGFTEKAHPAGWIDILLRGGGGGVVAWPMRELGWISPVPGMGKKDFNSAHRKLKTFHTPRVAVLVSILSTIYIPRLGPWAGVGTITADHVRMIDRTLFG